MDFFISAAPADGEWAEWMAWQLEDAGFSVLLPAWDGVAGSHRVTNTLRGIDDAGRTIALLSAEYFRSTYQQAEWQAAFAADPLGFGSKLVPVRLDDCAPPGLLRQIVSIDARGDSPDAVRARLLDALASVLSGRAKPRKAPPFPVRAPRPDAPVSAPLLTPRSDLAAPRSDRGAPRPVVVLTALELERDAVHATLDDVRTETHPSGTLFEVGALTGTSLPVVVAVTDPGNIGAAIMAERAIAAFDPQAVFFVGVAGALHPDLALGDVLVATRVYYYHAGREGPDGFHGRPRAWEASHRLDQIARHTARRRPGSPSVHFRPLAAGEVVLDSLDGDLVTRLRHDYDDAAAVEMESAGLAQAAHVSDGRPTLTVRGISDHADGRKTTADGAGWQRRAAANAAGFTAAMCRALDRTPLPTRPPLVDQQAQ